MPFFSSVLKQRSAHHSAFPVEIVEQIIIDACKIKDGGQTAAALLLVSRDVRAIALPYRYYSICVTGRRTLGLLESALKRASAEQLANIRDVFLADRAPEDVHPFGLKFPGLPTHGFWHRDSWFFGLKVMMWTLGDLEYEAINKNITSILSLCASSVQSLTLVALGYRRLEPVDASMVFASLEELSLGFSVGGSNLDPEDLAFPLLHSMRIHTSGRQYSIEQLAKRTALSARRNSCLKHVVMEGFYFKPDEYIQDGTLDLTNPILNEAAKRVRIDIIPNMGTNILEGVDGNTLVSASDLTGILPIRRALSVQEWPAGFFITPAVPVQNVYASSITRWLGQKNLKARQKKTLQSLWRPRAATLIVIQILPLYFRHIMEQWLEWVRRRYPLIIHVVVAGWYPLFLAVQAVHIQSTWTQLLRDYYDLVIVVVVVSSINMWLIMSYY